MDQQRLNTLPELRELRKALTGEQTLMRRGILTDADTGREYFTGYDYKTLYDWDQYFEAIVQVYMGWPSDYIKNAVTIFLDHQQPSGLISRSVPSNEWHDPEHVKPFLAQTALLVKECYGETDWILNDNYFPKLKRYLDYWLGAMDGNGNGLAEWMSAPHTGMDNQHERAGWWRDRISEGVDLNCYIYRDLLAFARLAEDAGQFEVATEYRGKATALGERIQSLMWDEESGFYYDLQAKTGQRIPVKAVSGFAPLWAGLATREQAKQLIYGHLFNATEFWSPWPVATLARSEPGYSQTTLERDLGCNWRACTWISTNYMIFASLRHYGFGQLASLVANATRRLMERAGNREWYNSETGEGNGLNPFWGWSLLGHFMEFEDQTGVDLTKIV